MRRIADDGLVEIADLDIDPSFDVGDRAEITDMTIAANP
jgi:hypothetical protein